MSIKVLVVDDSREKIRQYKEVFLGIGISWDNVEVALSSHRARDELKRTQYDLMLLDLALPTRPEDDPSQRGGVDLLKEIYERPRFHRPGRIIGITAFDNLSEQYGATFQDRLVSLIHFDKTSERWKVQLTHALKDLDEVKRAVAPVEYGKDVCIITALRDPELQAVRDLDYEFGDGRLLVNSEAFYHEGSVTVGDRGYSVVASAAPAMGLVDTAIHAEKLVTAFRPRLLVMTGICAGTPGRVNPGDVILANPAWNWQSGKRVLSDGVPKLLIEPHQLSVDRAVVGRFEQLTDMPEVWSSISSRWRGAKPDSALKGVIGPLASGTLVAADGKTLEEIQATQQRKLIGLDMEIYAVYKVANLAIAPKPLTFALKSVSDFGDMQKSDAYQAYAAYTSAQALHRFLVQFLPELVAPRD